jgi:hypothetical protein
VPKLLHGMLWKADSFCLLEEGRCPMGRNGQVHHGSHRGTGAFIQRRLCRDNVGKDRTPAGADSKLQRPSWIRHKAETRRRRAVWHMSPYERRRRGNARRSGGTHHSKAGNTEPGQRGSRHLAVPGDVRTQNRNASSREAGTNLQVNHSRGANASQRLNLLRTREGLQDNSQGQNRTREIRPSGIAGGSWETRHHGETRNPHRTLKGRMWSLLA